MIQLKDDSVDRQPTDIPVQNVIDSQAYDEIIHSNDVDDRTLGNSMVCYNLKVSDFMYNIYRSYLKNGILLVHHFRKCGIIEQYNRHLHVPC